MKKNLVRRVSVTHGCAALLFILLSSGTTWAQPSIAARIDSIRTFFTTEPVAVDLFGALERARREEMRADGLQRIASHFRAASNNVVERYRLTAAYLFTRDYLPDSTEAIFRAMWRDVPMDPPASEHERICGATALLLACDALGLEQKYYNGKSIPENREESMSLIGDWMDAAVKEGQQEFDSPTYGPLLFTAMLLNEQFAADKAFAKRAGAMASWLFADYFHEYLGGQFGGAHAREEMNSAMQPMISELAALAWFYVGDGAQIYAREQYLATLFTYRPHPTLLRLATSREKPYEVWEWKRSADRLRGDTARVRLAPKYTYMDPLYVMGHVRGGLLQPREQRTWSLLWSSDSPQNTLFTMQPYSEAASLTSFTAHSPELVLRENAKVDPYFGTITKTVGGSPYEDVFQYKSTLIALYDIPEIKRYQALVGFFPADVRAFDVDSTATGWITIDAGDVYIGYYPLAPYTLRPEPMGRRLFSRAGRNGAIVQVVGRGALGSYDDFRRRLLRTKPDTSAFTSDGVIRYQNVFRDRLECTFGGTLRVNGSPYVSDPSLLFSSPLLESRRGSGRMVVRGGARPLVIEPLNALVREE
ncbi:MAG: hypothetical protein HY962_15395 [Ignavibacteriae bacterium]|nr:hypothetical protein [Ignavibacteriota bacterium]